MARAASPKTKQGAIIRSRCWAGKSSRYTLKPSSGDFKTISQSRVTILELKKSVLRARKSEKRERDREANGACKYFISFKYHQVDYFYFIYAKDEALPHRQISLG